MLQSFEHVPIEVRIMRVSSHEIDSTHRLVYSNSVACNICCFLSPIDPNTTLTSRSACGQTEWLLTHTRKSSSNLTIYVAVRNAWMCFLDGRSMVAPLFSVTHACTSVASVLHMLVAIIACSEWHHPLLLCSACHKRPQQFIASSAAYLYMWWRLYIATSS